VKTLKTNAGEHHLGQAIPYLLASTGARMGNAFAKRLKPFGLSLSEWRVCASLQQLPDQTLSELAENTSSDLSAMSRIVDRLVALELVERHRNENDGRAVRIELTTSGRALTRKITPLARQYEAIALSDFAPEEVDQLRDFLTRIYRNATPLA
jgi:DNA-binding MarR family transcriptional regulator